MALWQQEKSFSAIAAQLHISPTTVSKFVQAGAFPERVARPRSTGYLGPYLPYLQQWVEEGCENARVLWRELSKRGFTGGYKMVNIWLREYLQHPNEILQTEKKHDANYSCYRDLSSALKERMQSQGDAVGISAEGSCVLLEGPLPSPRHLVWLLLRNAEYLVLQ